jgi:Na+/proline symporter
VSQTWQWHFSALWFGLKVREKISIQEFESVSEMLAKTYHADWVRFIYWAGIFVFLLPYVAIQIKGISSFLSVAFPVDIPNWCWSLFILLAILIYSHLGGLKGHHLQRCNSRNHSADDHFVDRCNLSGSDGWLDQHV